MGGQRGELALRPNGTAAGGLLCRHRASLSNPGPALSWLGPGQKCEGPPVVPLELPMALAGSYVPVAGKTTCRPQFAQWCPQFGRPASKAAQQHYGHELGMGQGHMPLGEDVVWPQSCRHHHLKLVGGAPSEPKLPQHQESGEVSQ